MHTNQSQNLENKLYTYRVCNLTVRLPVFLAGYQLSNNIHQAEINLCNSQEFNEHCIANAATVFRITEKLKLAIIKNNFVIINIDASYTNLELQFAVEKVALPILLSQLGFGALHASAVMKDNKATLFVGDCQSGKSTLARACCNLDYKILADDLVFFKLVDSKLVVWLSNNHLRLRSTTFNYFSSYPREDLILLKQINEPSSKGKEDIRHIVTESNTAQTTNLYHVSNVFIINPTSRFKISLLDKTTAYKVLLQNSYTGIAMTCPKLLFENLHLVVESTKVYQLDRPDNLNIIPEIISSVSQLTNAQLSL